MQIEQAKCEKRTCNIIVVSICIEVKLCLSVMALVYIQPEE